MNLNANESEMTEIGFFDFVEKLPEYKPFVEKSFKCSICGKNFSLEKWLIDHKQTKH